MVEEAGDDYDELMAASVGLEFGFDAFVGRDDEFVEEDEDDVEEEVEDDAEEDCEEGVGVVFEDHQDS